MFALSLPSFRNEPSPQEWEPAWVFVISGETSWGSAGGLFEPKGRFGANLTDLAVTVANFYNGKFLGLSVNGNFNFGGGDRSPSPGLEGKPDALGTGLAGSAENTELGLMF